MANEVLETVGMKCPLPILKIAAKAPDMKPGDTLEVVADCATFEADIRLWADRMKKTVLWVRDEGGGKKRAQLQF